MDQSKSKEQVRCRMLGFKVGGFFIFVLMLFVFQGIEGFASQANTATLTGLYKGHVQMDRQSYEARLGLVEDQGGHVRGIITVDIRYTDQNGRSWQGASLFVRGKAQRSSVNSTTDWRLTHYQCSAVGASLCKRFTDIDTQFLARIKQTSSGIELTQVRPARFFSFEKPPFEGGRWDKVSGPGPITISEPSVSHWAGAWRGVGVMPTNLFVPTPIPYFSEVAMILEEPEQDQTLPWVDWWMRRSTEPDFSLEGNIRVAEWNAPAGPLRLRLWTYQYIMEGQSRDGIITGRLDFGDNVHPDFDFFGLFWLEPNR